MSSRRSGLATVVSLALCTALVFSGACSSSTTHPPIATDGTGVGTGGGGGGSEGGTTSDASSDIDGGHCLTGTFDVDADTGLGGTNEIAGTVNFSMSVGAGHTIVLTITNTMNVSVTYADTFSFPKSKDSFTFRLRNLPDATYALQAQADTIGSSGVLDAGDLDGYFGGTTVTPVHTRADSTTITVPACRGGSEFGIGPKQ